MSHRVLRWPVERRLVRLLQTPAHRVVRVQQVTMAQWAAAGTLASAQAPDPEPSKRTVAREVALTA